MLNIEKTFGYVEKFDLIGNRMVGSPDGRKAIVHISLMLINMNH